MREIYPFLGGGNLGVKKGLSVDGVRYFSDILNGNKKPEWMEFSKQLAKLTGDYRLLNLATGIQGLDSFLFKSPKWKIGNIAFDGIMRTEHTSRVRATEYPVQTGVYMTDHAIIEPAEVTIEIMMSDSHTTPFTTHNQILDTIYNGWKAISMFSNFVSASGRIGDGEGRSIDAWGVLKQMQQSRVPLTVETRLQTYNNMIIEELSAPDDAKTLHALKATVRLREIIVADVAETKVSARAASYEQSSGGQVQAQTEINDTALEKIKGGLGF